MPRTYHESPQPMSIVRASFARRRLSCACGRRNNAEKKNEQKNAKKQKNRTHHRGQTNKEENEMVWAGILHREKVCMRGEGEVVAEGYGEPS